MSGKTGNLVITKVVGPSASVVSVAPQRKIPVLPLVVASAVLLFLIKE